MLSRSEKEALVGQIRERIEKSEAVFLTNLIGVESNFSNDLRKQIRDVKGSVVVTRNTLFQRAAQGTSVEEIVKGIKGPNALAFAYEDAAAVAKCLKEAGKKSESVVLGAGVLNGDVLSVAQVNELADLPSKDEMLATLLATFNAPISAFARVLNSIREKKEAGSETVAAVEEATAE